MRGESDPLRFANEAPIENLLGLLAEGSRQPGATSPRDSIFVVGDTFGTRSSTVLLLDADGHAVFVERRFGPAAKPLGESRFELEIVHPQDP